MIHSCTADAESLLNAGRNAPANVQSCSRTLIAPIVSGTFPDPILTLKPIVTAPSILPTQQQIAENAVPSINAHFNQNNQRAQIQMQTMQIDGAIKLLKMQYEAIMCNVRKSQEAVFGPHSQNRERPFLSQFDLVGTEWKGPRMMSTAAALTADHSCAAHRKRQAEDSSMDDAARKKISGASGKLVLDSEVSSTISGHYSRN